MAVINPKPHLLSFLEVSEGYEDENGDFHGGTTKWSKPIKCHAVPAGRANEISFPDGSVDYYSYTVGRLDPHCHQFKIGEKVRLTIDDTEREFKVKGFHRYQLQSKIWV